MKTNICQKLKTPFLLWQTIFKDPVDFIELLIEARSGNRSISGSINYRDSQNDFQAVLPGEKWQGTAEQINDWLLDHISRYDSVRLVLRLRGKSQLIEADNKGVKYQPNYKDDKPAKQKIKKHSYGASEKRDYKIKIDEAADLLMAIDIIDASGKLKNDKWRKYHQIDRFVELAEPVLNQLAKEQGTLEIFDLACGKSYLSFVLNYFIKEKMGLPCNFTGIDISEDVVKSSRKLAQKLSYRNMKFECMDLRDFQPQGKVSLCISLHACDTATDMAIAAAVKANSKAVIVVPCCQRELLAADYKMETLASSVMTAGILKARLADIITDGMRLLLLRSSGYETSIIEYISPLETPKNLMIKAILNGNYNQKSWLEYQKLAKNCDAEITLGKELNSMIKKKMNQTNEAILNSKPEDNKSSDDFVKITIATGNKDKVKEIKEIIDIDAIKWQTMDEAGFKGEIIEDGDSYKANALIKARAVQEFCKGWVIADDSGLSVDVLDGAPGIYSARFAGESAGYKDKIACLHKMLEEWPQNEWSASFVCAIALIAPDGREWTVEERVNGIIAAEAAGENGFGYDPIFYVPEYGCTTAQMTPQQKHAISHRGKALRALMDIIERENLLND